MRCDGLPDPSSLPQLNAYRNRWMDVGDEQRPSMERLGQRAPELGRVIRDLDDLLEDTRDIKPNLVAQLYQVYLYTRLNLSLKFWIIKNTSIV